MTTIPIDVTSMEGRSAADILHKIDERKREDAPLLGSKASTPAASTKELHKGNIIEIVRQEHDEIDRLYAQYLSSNAGEVKEAKGFLILRQLVMHLGKEEAVLYPAIRAKLDNGKALADQCELEHQRITADLYELDKLTWPQNPGEFDRLVRVVMESMHKHVLHEETELLPKLIAVCSTQELTDLGGKFMSQIVTTRPHPSAPREGWSAQLAQAAMMPVDAIRDAVRFDDKTRKAATGETK